MPDEYIKKVYDLKGSLSGREVECPPSFDKNKKDVKFEEFFKNTAVLKDINFLNIHKDEVVMKFNKATAKRVSR